MAISIDSELTLLSQIPGIGQYLGSALRTIVEGVNQLGVKNGTDPLKPNPAPAAIQGLNVKSDGNGNVHAVINDNTAIAKSLNYFVEYDTHPAFPQPHVEQLGASRTMRPMPLPAQDDNGNAQSWYFRAYSQYPDGKPGPKINFGGATASPVAVGGTSKCTLIPSTGSGTSQNTGQEGGQGFGRAQFRATAQNISKKRIGAA